MPTKKKQTQKKKSAPAVPARVKLLTAVLVVILVGGVTAVKYFQSPPGRVVLLDRGFDTYYTQVRDDIGGALASALGEFDLRDAIGESIEVGRRRGHTFHRLAWDIPCPDGTDLLLVNVALTEAIERVGAHVRQSDEADGGKTLVFTAGTQFYETHQLTIRKPGPVARVSTPDTDRVQPPAGRRPDGRLAIVIDDFGYQRNDVVSGMLSMGFPVSISILPSLPHSRYVLEKAKEMGRCVLLHLPMEANEPYPTDLTVVTVKMSDREIFRVVERYLLSLPGVEGVNNHQGSLATTDRRVMDAVLQVVERHHMFFLDSLTSPKSVAYNTARELGMPAARNSIFLDDDTEDAAVVEERLRRAVQLARNNGIAVAIGHPHRWTFDALRSSEKFLLGAGVDLVYVSELVE